MPKLWTCQEPRVVESLLREGALHVDVREMARFHEQGGDFRYPYAYRWLADRLGRVIPDYGGGLPWWLHTTYPQGAENESYWILELVVPAERCFRMPYWAWDMVAGGRFVPTSNAEWSKFQSTQRRTLRRLGQDNDDQGLGTWFGSAEEVLQERDAQPEPLRKLDDLRRASFERLFERGVIPHTPPRSVRRAFGYRKSASHVAVTEVLKREDLRSLFDPAKGQWSSPP